MRTKNRPTALTLLIKAAPVLAVFLFGGLYITWELFLRANLTKHELAAAFGPDVMFPVNLGETRDLLEKRVKPYGWTAREVEVSHSDLKDKSATVEYRRWPGLFFTVVYVNGRVNHYQMIE